MSQLCGIVIKPISAQQVEILKIKEREVSVTLWHSY
jgi:hypothetical protein